MMAHHELPGPRARALSRETTALLRDAALRVWREPHGQPAGDAVADDAMRAAVAALVAEAREHDLRAEELVVAFKHVLEEVGEQEGAPLRPDVREFQRRLVTLCIKTYYGA